MSKKHLLAKRLLLAVTCAAGIQMLAMQTVWAVATTDTSNIQQTNTDATTAEETEQQKQERLAKEEQERLAKASTQTNYFSRSTMSNEIAPRATSPAPSSESDMNLLIGSGAINSIVYPGSVSNSIVIAADSSKIYGYYAVSIGNGNIAYDGSVVIGWNSKESYDSGAGDSVLIGSSVETSTQFAVAVGERSAVYGEQGVAVGYGAVVDKNNSVAIGYKSKTTADNQVNFAQYDLNTGELTKRRSLAGVSAIEMEGALTGVSTINGIAIGDGTTAATTTINGINFGTANKIGGVTFSGTSGQLSTVASINGIAIGATDKTINSINFGTANKIGGVTFSGTSGQLNTVTAINTVAVAGSSVSTGLTIGGNAILGKTNTPFSSTGFSVGSAGAVTAASLSASGSSTIGGVTLNGNAIGAVKSLAFSGTGSGAITGVSNLNGLAVAGTSVSTGLTIGGNAILGKTNTPFSSTGFSVGSAGAVTAASLSASGSSTIGGVTLNGNNITLSGTVDGVDIAALNTTVGSATSGLIKTVGDMDTAYKFADTALDSRITTNATNITTNASDINSLQLATTGMSYNAANGGTTTFAGGLAANSLAIGSYGMASDGALTAKSVNGVTVSSTGTTIGSHSLDTMSQDILDLKTNGGATSANTVGISHAGTVNTADSITTIEANTKISASGINTNALTATGTVTANEFVENGKKLSESYAAKSSVDTLVTTVGDTNSGLVKGVADNTAAIATNTTDIGDLKTTVGDTTSGLVKGVADNTAAIATNTTDIGDLKTTVGDTTSGLVKGVADNTAAIATNTTDIGTLQTTVGDANSGLVKGVADNTAVIATNTTDIGNLQTATTGMSYNAANGGTTTFAGALAANSIAVGSYGMASDGALTAKSVNGVAISSNKTTIGSYSLEDMSTDINALKGGGGGATENTVGITRTGDGTVGNLYTTTVESNTSFTTAGVSTNAIVASGSVTATEFVEGSSKLADKYAAKSSVDTLVTTVGDANSGLVKGVADNTNAIAAKADSDAGNLSSTDKTAWQAALGVVDYSTDITNIKTTVGDANSGLVKGVADNTTAVATNTTDIGNLQTATTGMSYANNTTTFAGGLAANSLAIGSYGLANNGALTVTSINGITVGATDGKIDGVDISDLKATVDNLTPGGGGGTGTADTAGIKRDTANEKTTIEKNTHIDENGLTTVKLAADTAKIGGIEFGANKIGDIVFDNGAVKSIGAVNFGANGALSGIGSINGMSFGNGTIGGVSLSGGKVNGVDVSALQSSVNSLGNRVTSLENTPGGGGGGGTGGGGANTGGISKPNSDETVIEGNTTIDSDGITTGNLNATDKVIVAEGEDKQVTISKDGIHVGKNSSVVNDTDGFITDKGLYIGVTSSSDPSSAKFSVAPNGNLTSKAGSYTFSNTAANGAVFTDTSGSTASSTTIKGGTIETEELWVDGNKVTVAGGTIGQTQAVNNHLQDTKDGKDYTNDFKTSILDGTTQASSMTDTATGNKTDFTANTKYDGMSLTGNKTVVTKDASGNITSTKTETGKTTMTGDSITVSKTNTTKDKDGNDVHTTNSTTVGSGEIYLNKDGSSIAVGSAITGLQSDVRELDSKVSRMGTEIKEVGALGAALAGLHPMPEDANTRTSMAMAMGSYEGKQAIAVGGFYRPNKRTMLSVAGSFTTSKQMFNMGVSFALDKMPEKQYQGAQSGIDSKVLQTLLTRLDGLESSNKEVLASNKQLAENNQQILEHNKKLEQQYAELKAKYEKEMAAKNNKSND